MPRPKEYYFITHQYPSDGPRISNGVIDMHPLDWLKKKGGPQDTILFYEKISERQYRAACKEYLDDEGRGIGDSS